MYDDPPKALLSGIEHVLSERARWLEPPVAGTADHPGSRQQGVPLCGSFLQQVHYQPADSPLVRWVVDLARGRHGELLANALVREESAVHDAESDAVD
jgi:hypothetical protein